MSAWLGGQIQAAREIRVDNIETARPEPELARLHVDQNVVVERNRSGQARVGDAGAAVDLEPEEPFVLLEHGGDLPPPKAKRHRSRAPRQPRREQA